MAAGDAAAAAAATADVVRQLSDENAETTDDALARSANLPHGAAVASALKAAAHWTALREAATEGDGSDASGESVDISAAELYARAGRLAEECAASPAPEAAASAMAAEELVADVALGAAQRALRSARHASSRRARRDAPRETETAADALAAAESAAAAAVTAGELLGVPEHPRVGLAVACVGDVYAARAAQAAMKAGGIGDGSGVVFAEGLYRNALRMLGTPRAPTAAHAGNDTSAPDASASACGAARPHLRLVAAAVHARYAAVLRASGARRAAEADDWAAAAEREWPEGCGAATGAAVVDLQLMLPLVDPRETR